MNVHKLGNDSKDVTIGDELCSLVLWEMSELEILRAHTYNKADVVLICFSVVNPDSFDNIKEKWFPDIQCYWPGIPFLIVGTQIDLRDDPREIRELSQIGMKPIISMQGRKLAQELGAIKYVECSACTQEGLENVFDETIFFTALKSLKSLNKKRLY
ncbi:Cell division control protein 42 [Gigaspora margarita]|uniref:Cell division control protein 42 n=1 Tax=Gigaspora margarita TaxID=4874 RepID=A0A8H4EP06_GIGMA|nr:Cell division control protein 42 [Gigaspora margarita]